MPRTIPPIRPPAPDSWPTLLTVASEGGLAAAYDADGVAGWQVGVQSLDLESIRSHGWPPVCPVELAGAVVPDGTGTDDTDPNRPYPTVKQEPVYPPTYRFFPWTFYVNVGCGPDAFTAPQGADLDTWSDLVLQRETARAVSRELWEGYWTQGHSLMRDAIDLTGATAVDLEVALGLILEAVGGFGTWHVPTVAEPLMRAHGHVTDQGMVPRGPGGWPISFGPGYLRTAPVASPWRLDTSEPAGTVADPPVDSPAVTGNQVYIVGHAGRVEVAVRDVPTAQTLGGPGSRYHHNRTGLTESLRERRAIFRYSTGQVYAARVDLTSGS